MLNIFAKCTTSRLNQVNNLTEYNLLSLPLCSPVKNRVDSILKAHCLEKSITGFNTLDLTQLHIKKNLTFPLPTNLRLGHLAEKVVSTCIKASNNYTVLFENLQLIDGNRTIGELDFIIQNLETKEVIHLEMAYKFYLYDPSISNNVTHKWIGPNRNDSLSKKLEKLKNKQFPLLQHPLAKALMPNINTKDVVQSLCLLASLYVPYNFKHTFNPDYSRAIKGHYLDFETFKKIHHNKNAYHAPTRKKWGMDPKHNSNWVNLEGVLEYISTSLQEKQAPLIWQKQDHQYSSFFVVWW